MSKKQLEAFFETAVAEDAALREEIEQQGDDMAAIVSIGQREGYTFTPMELASYMESYRPEGRHELEDEELEEVSGSGWTSSCSCGCGPPCG